jgi:outer membrane immunogenic protein
MKARLQAASAAAAFLTASLTAYAADLPSRPLPPAAPVVVQAPAYNWTGLYLGVNGGYGWGRQDPLALVTSPYDPFAFDINGWMVGGTVGAQIQSGRVVLGVEGDIDWANIKGSITKTPTILGVPAPFSANLSTEITSVSTIRMRVGYALDNWLLYGTGGVALLGGKTDIRLAGATCNTAGTIACAGTSDRVGIAAGGGIEYGFSPNWSTKLEYIWVGGGAIHTATFNTVRAGLNYRFGAN